MALFRPKLFIFSALILWAGIITVFAEGDDGFDDEVTVEVDEEEDGKYQSPHVDAEHVYISESFDDPEEFEKRWVKSEAKKEGVDETIAKYNGEWEIRPPIRKIFKNDLGLVLTTEAKHGAISSLLDKPFHFTDKPLIVQYEVTMQEGLQCGGAYLKLLSKGSNTKGDLRKFNDQTAYTIMFGPDKCGTENKLHFIFRHQNPKTGIIEEKHSKKPDKRLDDSYKDKEPHLYKLVLRPDNTFSISVDGKEMNSGSLLKDFIPPVNPPEEIDDPEDTIPEDWDEREKIEDPNAKKPENWDGSGPPEIVDILASIPLGWLEDEPVLIPDPKAVKPEDWDVEIDGEWEAPLIDNPVCKDAPGCGEWKAPLIPNPDFKGIWTPPIIPNPNYRGKWAPRKIPNPEYYNDDNPFKMTSIHAIGFELWSMSPNLLFDNLIVTDDPKVAAQWVRQTFILKRNKISSDSVSLWGRAMKAMNYKPGWWAVYFVYVAIPITIYVCYLVRRINEDTVVERSLKFAGDNPWIYAVVIIGAFVLVGLVAYLCCGPRAAEPDIEHKKTDAVVEDDPHQSEGEDEHDEEDDERPTKADLESPLLEETEAAPQDTEGAGDAQRKRKSRKE